MIKSTNVKFNGETARSISKKEMFFVDDLVSLQLSNNTMISGRCTGIGNGKCQMFTAGGDITVDIRDIVDCRVDQLGQTGYRYSCYTNR